MSSISKTHFHLRARSYFLIASSCMGKAFTDRLLSLGRIYQCAILCFFTVSKNLFENFNRNRADQGFSKVEICRPISIVFGHLGDKPRSQILR